MADTLTTKTGKVIHFGDTLRYMGGEGEEVTSTVVGFLAKLKNGEEILLTGQSARKFEKVGGARKSRRKTKRRV